LLEGTKAKILIHAKPHRDLELVKMGSKMVVVKIIDFALYDMIMLKDNHNDFAGGITLAIKN
jgi:nicotinate-nucleotide pyrophosphorylase (carboxylating)